jgi:hypothetical protein
LLTLSGGAGAAFKNAVALADGLFPHQIEGVAFLLGRRRAIFADDMGLGKTRQAIVSLRHCTPGGPRLIVCPASVKRDWSREISVVAAAPRVRRAPDDASRQSATAGGNTRGARSAGARPRAEALVKVLSGPSARRFRISSASHAGVHYEIVAVDADVTCSCPGFEYRGQCRHARDVKAALAAGEPVPARYAEVSET